jgi:hypothetical protein
MTTRERLALKDFEHACTISRRDTRAVADMVLIRDILANHGILERQSMNAVIRRVLKNRAIERDALNNAADKCFRRGHKWAILDQRGWDAGYDSPVRCLRCGEIDM